MKQYTRVPNEPAKPLVPMAQPLVGVQVVSAQPLAVPANYVDAEATLAHTPGLMVRQKLFISQVLCQFLERRNRYTISHWDHTTTSRAPTDDVFARMPKLLEAREESTCCCRYGCRSHRALEVGIFPPNVPDGQGFPAGVPPLLRMRRPFRCTMLCPSATKGCDLVQPQELRVERADGSLVGVLVQDWRCGACLRDCNTFVRVTGAGGEGDVRHVWRTNGCCCGESPDCCLAPLGCGFDRCGNCFAPSCVNPSFTIDVLDAEERHVVGSLDVVWPGWNCKGVLAQGFENFLLRFPEGAAGDERALMLAGLMLHDYLVFEKRKDGK
eukprot:g1482.t1